MDKLRLTARIAALVVGEAGALLGLWSAALPLLLFLTGSIFFGGPVPSSIAIDAALTLFSLLAFAAALLVLVNPRMAALLLSLSTFGVLIFGYLQLPALPLPEEVSPPQVPLYFWAITATPLLLLAAVLAVLGREQVRSGSET